jgi:iron(III) transport system substrate-binding protein
LVRDWGARRACGGAEDHARIDRGGQEGGQGLLVYSVDLPVAEKVAKSFEAAYPGISMRVERSGAERIFQRIGQEYQSKIYVCDVVNSSDAAHLIIWKRANMLASYLPEDVAQHFPKEHWDPDGMYASWRLTLSPIAYNTSLVKAEDAPQGFNDLLDPKWLGKIVKAHPATRAPS